MKTYVLTVSTKFPQTHPKKGEDTEFVEKILMMCSQNEMFWRKFHTIRANFDLWKKRIEEIQTGKAILSIRYWSDKPYRSPQTIICELDKNSGIGIQKVNFTAFSLCEGKTTPLAVKVDEHEVSLSELAANDGLELQDFKDWFKGYDLNKPMALIQFTSWRYPF